MSDDERRSRLAYADPASLARGGAIDATAPGARGIGAIGDASKLLSASVALWWAVAAAGQWAFFYYIAAFYGVSALDGEPRTWNRLRELGSTSYVAGDDAGNLAFFCHAIGAGIIALGGALQLVPWLRRRAPRLHRYNGRTFLVTATALALSGFYLVWVRGSSPSVVSGLSTTFNGALILAFAWLAWRSALARDFGTHRRWAMRLYLVCNAQWFLRVGFFSHFIVGRALGAEPSKGDLFLSSWTFGCYLVPLAVLQLYFWARDRGGNPLRIGVAGAFAILTLLMGAGIVGLSGFLQAIITGAPLKF